MVAVVGRNHPVVVAVGRILLVVGRSLLEVVAGSRRLDFVVDRILVAVVEHLHNQQAWGFDTWVVVEVVEVVVGILLAVVGAAAVRNLLVEAFADHNHLVEAGYAPVVVADTHLVGLVVVGTHLGGKKLLQFEDNQSHHHHHHQAAVEEWACCIAAEGVDVVDVVEEEVVGIVGEAVVDVVEEEEAVGIVEEYVLALVQVQDPEQVQ